MSALDQQVELQRARELVFNRMRGSFVPDTDEWVKNRDLLDALLTTHRRQVLQEIEEKIRQKNAAHIKEMGGYHNRAVAMTWDSAADFVASLRDTKEET